MSSRSSTTAAPLVLALVLGISRRMPCARALSCPRVRWRSCSPAHRRVISAVALSSSRCRSSRRTGAIAARARTPEAAEHGSLCPQTRSPSSSAFCRSSSSPSLWRAKCPFSRSPSGPCPEAAADGASVGRRGCCGSPHRLRGDRLLCYDSLAPGHWLSLLVWSPSAGAAVGRRRSGAARASGNDGAEAIGSSSGRRRDELEQRHGVAGAAEGDLRW